MFELPRYPPIEQRDVSGGALRSQVFLDASSSSTPEAVAVGLVLEAILFRNREPMTNVEGDSYLMLQGCCSRFSDWRELLPMGFSVAALDDAIRSSPVIISSRQLHVSWTCCTQPLEACSMLPFQRRTKSADSRLASQHPCSPRRIEALKSVLFLKD